MSAKQAINDKLQDSVATYLRCDGVVNNQIKKGLLLSLWVKKIMWLSRALSSSFSSVLARCAKCMRQSRSCLWLCQIFTYLKKISLRDSAINLSYFCLLKSSPHLKYVTRGIFQWTKCKSAKIWRAPWAVTGGPCHGRLSLRLRYDTIRDAILTCARKPT